MSLSDKIMDVISGEEIIFISDVKQAVKELKEEVNQKYTSRLRIKNAINSIFGEKLL